ncbi:hypothetical protein A6R68_19632 [Neotoma lepida]|uniref:Uncharacterized protein n=1 Tax=Neotoma lepida TaxID=56216 RepID=A0A1A6HI83_NEOLE|nr:hypothetical protein A6R68_19632 [Neotoma lepida]
MEKVGLINLLPVDMEPLYGDVMETFKSRIAKLETLQQATQLEMMASLRTRPKDFLFRFISLLLTLTTILLVLVSTLCSCPLPLLNSRLRTITVFVLIGLGTLAWQKRHIISIMDWQAWVPFKDYFPNIIIPLPAPTKDWWGRPHTSPDPGEDDSHSGQLSVKSHIAKGLADHQPPLPGNNGQGPEACDACEEEEIDQGFKSNKGLFTLLPPTSQQLSRLPHSYHTKSSEMFSGPEYSGPLNASLSTGRNPEICGFLDSQTPSSGRSAARASIPIAIHFRFPSFCSSGLSGWGHKTGPELICTQPSLPHNPGRLHRPRHNPHQLEKQRTRYACE